MPRFVRPRILDQPLESTGQGFFRVGGIFEAGRLKPTTQLIEASLGDHSEQLLPASEVLVRSVVRHPASLGDSSDCDTALPSGIEQIGRSGDQLVPRGIAHATSPCFRFSIPLNVDKNTL